MIAPDQITKNLDTGIITFFQDGFVVGSCKDTCVIQPINFKSSNNNRGFVVFTGAPQSPENTRYSLIEISIDNLVKITVGTTDTNFTPPSSLPPLYDPTTYRTAYNAVFALLSSKVFRSCCPTVVNVTGEAVLFYEPTGIYL